MNMISYISQGGDVSYRVSELIADKRFEIENNIDIPKDCAPGSTCIVAEDGSVWLLGSDRWYEM